jgi:hypothetical protein
MKRALTGIVMAVSGCASPGGHATGTMHASGGSLGAVDVEFAGCTGSVQTNHRGTTLLALVKHRRRGGNTLSIYQGPDLSGGTYTHVSVSGYGSSRVDVSVDLTRCARHDVSIAYEGGLLRAAADLDCNLPDGGKLRALARVDTCQITQVSIGS